MSLQNHTKALILATTLSFASCSLLLKPKITEVFQDENGDGIEERIVTEHDEFGRPIKISFDFNRDNIWDEISWGSYNKEGIMDSVYVDYNNDGLADEVCREEFQGEVLRKIEYLRYDEHTRKVLLEMKDYFDEQGKLARSETVLPQEGERFVYHPER